MKKINLYFEIRKNDIVKIVSFISSLEMMDVDIEYWKMVHMENGWNVTYRGYLEVK